MTEDTRHDDIDPELVALADSKDSSVLKPILMIGVILVGFWALSDWTEELSYFFLDAAAPQELGQAMELGEKKELPHNAYISVQGVPMKRSQSDRYYFFSLVGSQIFVEQPRDDYIDDPIERELKKDEPGDVDRTRFNGKGRLLRFDKVPPRYNGLRRYYGKRYGIVFCDQLTAQQRKQREAEARELIRAQYKEQYEAASPEFRATLGLKPQPSDETVERIMKDEPVCSDAYLLQADIAPKDHWWYLAAAGLFGLFMLINFVLLIRWIIRFFRQ